MRECDIDDCHRKHFSNGLCQAHYSKKRRADAKLDKPTLATPTKARVQQLLPQPVPESVPEPTPQVPAPDPVEARKRNWFDRIMWGEGDDE